MNDDKAEAAKTGKSKKNIRSAGLPMQARLIEYKWRRFFLFSFSIDRRRVDPPSINYTSISRWKFSSFTVKRKEEKMKRKKNEKETLIRLDSRDIKIVRVWRFLLPTRVVSVRKKRFRVVFFHPASDFKVILVIGIRGKWFDSRDNLGQN